MNLETFEELWPERDRMDDETRALLEQMYASDRHCRAYADGGDWVRVLLQADDPELAPADLSYRMRLFAQNNPDTDEPGSRSWLRWPVVTVGAAAGVAAMFVAFGPMLNEEHASTAPASAGHSGEEDARMAPVPLVLGADETGELAKSSDSTRADSVKTPARDVDQPDWDMRAVSAGNQ